MIKRSLKTCIVCQEQRPIFSKKMCHGCWKRNHAKPIKKISEKQKTILAEYKVIRDRFMKEHPNCKANLEGCTKKSEECHHVAGKNSREDWLNTENFMALCKNCHHIIETSGAWVYEKGFKIRRS